MGTTESGDCRPHPGRFKQKGWVELYHFGQVQLFFDEVTQQDVIQTLYQFILEVDSEVEFMNKLKNNNNDCPYLINMIKIETQIQSLCATTKTFHVYFEHLPQTLQTVFDRRTEPFPESEVRLLLSCLLESVKFINEHQTYHGDIFPEFIYLDERTPRIKIYDSAYFNPLKHGTFPRYLGYYRALEQASYSSPEVLANVSERRTFPLYNHFVSDTFSIGLVCLYAMTLINPLAAYKLKTHQIDYYYIEMLLRIASQKGFSQELVACVGECVLLKNRPTASEVLENYSFLQGNSNSQKLSLRK